MKKVRYTLGAVGAITPLALAAPPGGAIAMHPAHSSGARGKTVALRSGKVTPDTCGGNKLAKKSSGAWDLSFWYAQSGTRSTCIGQAYTSIPPFGITSPTTYVRFRAYRSGGHLSKSWLVKTSTGSAHVAIRRWFADPAMLCVAWLADPGAVKCISEK
jgi:hypothetical protein